VRYGFAKVLGIGDTTVRSRATAKVFSPLISVAPFYATTACQWGEQTLKDNSGGLSLPVTVPKLSHDGETNTSTLSGTLAPSEVALSASGVTVAVPGSSLGSVTEVGFFRSDKSEPVTAVPTEKTATTVKVVVPDQVTAVQDVWYVRVKTAGNWSERSEALSLLVGAAVLECDPGSSAGNFGTLDLPGRSGSTDDQAAFNMALGLVPGLTLAKYPDPVPTALCPESDSRTVYSTDGLLKKGTNCADTQPGLRSNAATDGLVRGPTDTVHGRLDKDTSPACTAVGRGTRADSGINKRSGSTHVMINDDLLTCFFKEPGTTISQATDPNYAGPPLFTKDIYDSPRFAYVPIFQFDPSGSKTMPIADLRPVFLTDQPSGASRATNFTGDQTNNGLVVKSNSIRAIKVIMFNPNTLPVPRESAQVTDYTGTGPRVIRMIR
jgi:hypothetical protein